MKFGALLFLSFSTLSQAAPLLLVDTNRDGKIDHKTDLNGRADTADAFNGALFLNNNDSDRSSGEPDWADSFVNGEDDLEDLAVIKIAAPKDLIASQRVTISVDEDSRPHVRLFAGRHGDWKSYRAVELDGNPNLDVTLLDKMELRIEANTYANATWSGECVVTLRIDGPDAQSVQDSVHLRVAPFILLSNAQRGNEVYVRDYPGQNDTFVEQLREIVPKADAKLVVIGGEDKTPYAKNHIWVQDTMEIGYQEMPGKRMSVVLRANRNKSLDNYPKDALLGPDYGWFEWSEFRPDFGAGDDGESWLDWYGNLEVSPPVTGYPLGRIYYGKTDFGASLNPEIVSMLSAQGVQGPPIALDVDWLLIKHVDEMVSFLPTGETNRPLAVMVPSTTEAIAVLKKANKLGVGNLTILDAFKEAFADLKKYPELTPNALLSDDALMTFNRELQTQRLDPMVEVLKKEFGLGDSDIIHVPYLQTQDKTAIFPNMVNSLILNGHILASDPRGPAFDEQDLMQGNFEEKLKNLPYKINFLDDARYHKWSGNTHCGTNARREGFAPNWWSFAPE